MELRSGGGPMDGWGVGRRSPAPPYPPWRPARPHTRVSLRVEDNAVPNDWLLREGSGRRQPLGTYPPWALPRNKSERPQGRARKGYRGKPRITLCGPSSVVPGPSSEYVRVARGTTQVGWSGQARTPGYLRVCNPARPVGVGAHGGTTYHRRLPTGPESHTGRRRFLPTPGGKSRGTSTPDARGPASHPPPSPVRRRADRTLSPEGEWPADPPSREHPPRRGKYPPSSGNPRGRHAPKPQPSSDLPPPYRRGKDPETAAASLRVVTDREKTSP